MRIQYSENVYEENNVLFETRSDGIYGLDFRDDDGSWYCFNQPWGRSSCKTGIAHAVKPAAKGSARRWQIVATFNATCLRCAEKQAIFCGIEIDWNCGIRSDTRIMWEDDYIRSEAAYHLKKVGMTPKRSIRR